MVESHLLIEINYQNQFISPLKKRPIDTETAEKFISKISRALEELGQSEISSNIIGTIGYGRFKRTRSCCLCKICISI